MARTKGAVNRKPKVEAPKEPTIDINTMISAHGSDNTTALRDELRVKMQAHIEQVAEKTFDTLDAKETSDIRNLRDVTVERRAILRMAMNPPPVLDQFPNPDARNLSAYRRPLTLQSRFFNCCGLQFNADDCTIKTSSHLEPYTQELAAWLVFLESDSLTGAMNIRLLNRWLCNYAYLAMNPDGNSWATSWNQTSGEPVFVFHAVLREAIASSRLRMPETNHPIRAFKSVEEYVRGWGSRRALDMTVEDQYGLSVFDLPEIAQLKLFYMARKLTLLLRYISKRSSDLLIGGDISDETLSDLTRAAHWHRELSNAYVATVDYLRGLRTQIFESQQEDRGLTRHPDTDLNKMGAALLIHGYDGIASLAQQDLMYDPFDTETRFEREFLYTPAFVLEFNKDPRVAFAEYATTRSLSESNQAVGMP